MRCRQARVLVSLKLDGELSSDRSAGLREHLAACTECRDYADDEARISAQLRRSIEPPGEILAELRESLRQSLREQCDAGDAGRPTHLDATPLRVAALRTRWRTTLAGAGAAAALILVVWGVFSAGGEAPKTRERIAETLVGSPPALAPGEAVLVLQEATRDPEPQAEASDPPLERRTLRSHFVLFGDSPGADRGALEVRQHGGPLLILELEKVEVTPAFFRGADARPWH
jgi:anti-sigma factor RsiW